MRHGGWNNRLFVLSDVEVKTYTPEMNSSSADARAIFVVVIHFTFLI